MLEIRRADMPGDLAHVRSPVARLSVMGNDEMEARHGFQLPVQEAVDHDIATIEKFQPPEGRLFLASENGDVFGTGAMKRIGPETAEIKRMWVDPSRRGNGVGRAMLDRFISAAHESGYQRLRLDSPDFMLAALPFTARTVSLISVRIPKARYRTSTNLIGYSLERRLP